MITNFEEITKELTKEDFGLLMQLIRGFERRTKKNPIKAPEIVKAMNEANPQLKSKFTAVKLRKLANFIRSKGMIGLIATSDGYYTSKDPAEIKKQIQSLNERAEAIANSARGMETYLNRLVRKQ